MNAQAAPRTAVVIPALNEAESIGKVLAEIPRSLVDRIVVADNGSTDETARLAQEAGAEVVSESRRGYGSACLAALASLRGEPPNAVVFLDADYSDYPEQIQRVLAPIQRGAADLVIGSRNRGEALAGSLTPQARAGNRLACLLMNLFWGVRFTDLGPFRAVSWEALEKLRMSDPDYGWTVEMQIKAILEGLRIDEVSVGYRARIGKSKISGTVQGVLGASWKILFLLFKYGFRVQKVDANR